MPYSRIAHNTDSSQLVQGDIGSIADYLASVIADREKQVNEAMANFQADDVDNLFQDVSNRFHRASEETKAIILLVQRTLLEDDHTAHTAQHKAKTAISI